jgi:cellulose synthase/poly-beta-1,6-N-acetylglucosamine synthase-like glycosyltransferase
VRAVSDALRLIRAILEQDDPADGKAREILDIALLREIDVFRYCSSTLGMRPELVMQRAAAWAGYAYFDRVPPDLACVVEPTYLESLASVRMFRVQVYDTEVAFAAPDFFGIIRLKHKLATMPELNRRLCLIPEPAFRDYLTVQASPSLIDGARQNLARRWPYATAHLELTRIARYGFVLALTIIIMMLLLAPFVAQMWLLPLSLGMLVVPSCIRLAAAFTRRRPVPRAHRPPDEELPDYSILIPLRNEANMVPQLFAAMRALDYPAERLDIKFVVEARSIETVAAVRDRLGDSRFSLVVVPDAAPRTKPKALDFALPLCRGDFVVVFDAEDIPDADQLWKAAVRFRDSPQTMCLQAELKIDNAGRNWLTALFAGDYAGHFLVLLPGLARWHLPMPLGGTSNHFRIRHLRELGGWDAYNVTEDADLGVRLARRRLRVDVLDSATRETAPQTLGPWLGQRTRWAKGWMQTFIVHNRDPGRLSAEMGLGPMLIFEALTLGMIVAPLLHLGYLMVLVIRWLLGLEPYDSGIWTVFYYAVLGLGYGSALLMTSVGLLRQRRPHLLAVQLLLPVYWILMSLATVFAAWELLSKPFYWFKSPHRPASMPLRDRRRRLLS